jgi:hypothetical protein
MEDCNMELTNVQMKEFGPRKEDTSNSIDLTAVVELLFNTNFNLYINSCFISSNRMLHIVRVSKSSKSIIFVFNLRNGTVWREMLYMVEWGKLSSYGWRVVNM